MKKVLVVDDEVDIREAFRSILARNDYGAFVAATGKEALEVAQTQHPDIILLDIMMPDMDGMDVLAALKKNENTKNIPVVMVTARGEQFNRDYCFEIGAYDYITKPCDAHQLLRQIANILEKTSG